MTFILLLLIDILITVSLMLLALCVNGWAERLALRFGANAWEGGYHIRVFTLIFGVFVPTIVSCIIASQISFT